MSYAPPTLDELRTLVAQLDPLLLEAEREVDETLIDFALARSPIERVQFAQQMVETAMRFRRVGSSSI